jgi:putative ABC transport system permease protein
MGFEREQIVILKVPERLNSKTETIKSEFNAITGVIESTASLGVPVVGSGFQTNFIPDLEHEDEAFMVSIKMIDVNYLNFYNIPLVAGRMLTEADEANFSEVTLVNEATVKKLGFASNEEALGKSYTIGLSDGKKRFSPQIVGVVKDFHFNSLHEEVSPLLFMNWPYLFKEISLKISPQNVPATIKEIEKVWKKFYPSHPFDFSFLDESIEAMYRAEERSFRLISTSSVLAILLACLGLLGLTSFTTEQRRKEIGVRKVLGASISNIINCLSLEFIKLIVISNLIAWPLSYYIIDKWLASFPYRVEMDMTNFLLGSLVTLTISLLTIGYIVFRSAAANPIESLRYE